jgi:RsiW-degrading membrane proteinase PrsW (M82 family)
VENNLQIIGSIFMAMLPAFAWGMTYRTKHPESRKFTAITFAVGALAVFPILIYKSLWTVFPWINAFQYADAYKHDVIGFTQSIALPLSIILTFMFVGVIEELMKMLSVKVVDEKKIKSIDDSIEFFIIAALGFSFTENILYFYNIWVTQGAGDLFLPFLFRSTFSTFAHLLFSGVLGYFYGVGHFAKPMLMEEIKAHRERWIPWFHRLTNIRSDKLFHQERLTEGLIHSIGLHALFNIFLEMGLTYMIVPFLICGYITLNYLLSKKENLKELDHFHIDERNFEFQLEDLDRKAAAEEAKAG